ncbi:MAG TPA: bifunctional helix-turn-helix transcriptional regulator/GNAT family N-acetyltransferase [Jatrophihabitantaceae bacterium]|nr:bifunctional helix-turn-helix transcriptional regulator/GNAT family N-acetyltransferase [Jatrophihabitantaceae bacterium]
MDDTVAAVRGFNRYYTNVIGALGEGHLHSPYTLTEARVLYELAQHESRDVVELRRQLDLDAGYLTRILTRFEGDGLVTRRRSETDGRRQIAALTKAGRTAFAALNRRANQDMSRLLAPLAPNERGQLRQALQTVRTLLDRDRPTGEVTLRLPAPGDLGWIVARNAELYTAEYGWDAGYETLVAGIVADFAATHDPDRERAWIAEVDGRRVGSIMCVRADDVTAKLRLLLVEPSARGLGVGTRLVDACVEFARDAGYARMTLWTQSTLVAARRIYAAVGFELAHSAPHHSFGTDLVGETWTMELSG